MRQLTKIVFLLALPMSFCMNGLAIEPIRPSFVDLDERRIIAVAAMLAERPAGFGKPITDRPAWQELARKNAYQKIIPQTARLLDKPLPALPDDLYLDYRRTGNRHRYQSVNSQRQHRIESLVLAECLENKGRFTSAFEETVRAICSQRTWVYPAHDGDLANFNGTLITIDLNSSTLAWRLATAYYLLADKLSIETRRLICDNIGRRVLDPFRDMVTGKRQHAGWMLAPTNNWNAVCLGGITGSALATLESRKERALFVAAAEFYSKNFLQSFSADGYCSEGVGYWNYGFGHYVLLAEAINQATQGGIDLLADKDACRPATYGELIEIMNGVCPAFADCAIGLRPSPRLMSFVNRRLSRGVDYSEIEARVESTAILYDAVMYSFSNPTSPTQPASGAPQDPELRSWFDKGGVLICRPAKDSSCRIGVALKGGHNDELHNHNDVGSYVLALGKQAILVDPGAEVYTARTFSSRRYESKLLNSYGHPVPLVAGQLQQPGRQAHADVLAADFTDEADTLSLDIRSAYNVPGLKKLKRLFVYSRREAGSLTVTDEVAFTSPKEFGTALITFGQWKTIGKSSLLVFDSNDAVRVDITAKTDPATSGDFQIQAERIDENVRDKTFPTRLGIHLTHPVKTATITLQITPTSGRGGPT